MVLYGRHPVREALRGPRRVQRIWATRAALSEPWLAGPGLPPVQAVSEVEILERTQSQDHQGICALVEAFRYADAAALLQPAAALLVALDQVQDPQNLGSICRTAECAGATGVIIPERRAAEVTAAVCKASAGAVEHLPVARVRNLADFLAAAKAAGAWCYGADMDGALDPAEIGSSGKLVLVLGSEGRGLRPRVAASCDGLVALPIYGRIESLSVGAAAAVLLYAVARPRRSSAGA